MRAVVITEPGGPEVLAVQDRPQPEPARCEILVRVVSSGVNRADLLQRAGNYPAPPGWPEDVPGLEFAGMVEATGPEASRWSVGDAVMGIVGGGGYAELLTTHEDTVVRVPERTDVLEAGAIPEVFMTAYDAVWRQMGLERGETLLVHAVGSGVGTAAVQVARAFGARTIGTSRTSEKLERAAELGLDHGVPGGDDWADRVLELTDGHGVHVILDLVGGPYLEENQRVLGRQGRHVVVGVGGGRSAVIDLRALMAKRGTIRGTVLRARPLEEKVELADDFGEHVLPLFDSGAIRPVVDRVLFPHDAPEAHRLLEENRTFGKVLLKW
jgi:putative PIG3 family NAD(P)H quinone oxidoreductase